MSFYYNGKFHRNHFQPQILNELDDELITLESCQIAMESLNAGDSMVYLAQVDQAQIVAMMAVTLRAARPFMH